MRRSRTVLKATRTLDDAGIPYALIGASAMSVHGVARTTRDADLLVTTARALRSDLWGRGGSPAVDVRTGDDDDPLLGVVRIGGDDATLPVDVVVPRGGRWLADVVERARSHGPRTRLGGVEVPVVTLEDLVLLKVDAGGYIDRQDIHLVFETWPERVPEIVAHVERSLPELSSWAAEIWRHVRQAP